MAKGGNNQRSNNSRFLKSYNPSSSFVTKVASRVSDYLGGWFGTPLKSCSDAETSGAALERAPGDATEKLVFDNVETRRSTLLAHRVLDGVDALSSSAKRFKVSDKERVDIDFPISPIPSTSGLYQEGVNHTFEIPGVPGPSDPRRDKFRRTTNDIRNIAPQTSSTTTDVKANGATDNHSDSSESTSGCSSLVPQSDRLSQSVYVCSTRKRNLEDKLKYARQLQHSRSSLYLNRSIPMNDAPGARKKPSFDVTAYGSPTLDKALLREKLINSPFYTGQTSYGGASAYRLSRNTFYSQRNPRFLAERREGLQVQVKPSHHGSTEDLSNMSHTAKKILEALEQFSTPVSDAKRIPVSRSGLPLGLKRRRFEDLSEARLRFSTPISPLNPNPGPAITGLNVPTVPDLLKLKRLERIQDSTSAARQVASQNQEYTLPCEIPQDKRTGKIVTKLKNREKNVTLEKLEEVNLPKIPLPITTLPKFDFQLPPVKKSIEDKTDKGETPKTRNFVFSPPIEVLIKELPEESAQKKSFKFSNPLSTDEKVKEPEKTNAELLLNFMSSNAVTKLKRKSISDDSVKVTGPQNLLLKPNPEPPKPSQNGFGDLFKKQANQWECSVCMIRNKDTDSKCAACETPRPGTKPEKPEQKFTFGSGSLGGGFKFGIDKAETEEAGVKSAADSSTYQLQANGLQPQSSTKPPQLNTISTSVGIFTFGIPPMNNKKEEGKTEAPKPPLEATNNFLVTSTSGSTLQKDDLQPEKRLEPEKIAEEKVEKESDSAKTDTVKPFTFGAPNKSPQPLFDTGSEVKPMKEPKSSSAFFSQSSNSNTLETVSSSTTDLALTQNKATGGQSCVSDAGSSKPPVTFHLKTITPPETVANPKLNLLFSGDKKSESTPLVSGTVTATLQPFTSSPTITATATTTTTTTTSRSPSPSPSPIFNAPKMNFGTPSTTSTGLTFGIGNSYSTSTSLFGASTLSCTTSGFSSQTSAAPTTSSFCIMSQSAEKPASSLGISFGSGSATFSTAPNPFAPVVTSGQNQDTVKSFGSFEANSGISSFGSNSMNSPSFGTSFVQPSTSEKPSVNAPFIFGSSASINTCAPAPPITAPGVFTFGAHKPESKQVFSFGQSPPPNFSFGSNVNSTSVFGGFGQPKTENSLGAICSTFGSSATGMFGQSSAPAAFEPTAPKFDFGSSTAQQQGASPSVFQFGAAPAQPASAPTGAGFSLSVPQKFNFGGGQTAVFSASPSVESSSALRGRTRKVIKAVRRTYRDPTRRPQ